MGVATKDKCMGMVLAECEKLEMCIKLSYLDIWGEEVPLIVCVSRLMCESWLVCMYMYMNVRYFMVCTLTSEY